MKLNVYPHICYSTGIPDYSDIRTLSVTQYFLQMRENSLRTSSNLIFPSPIAGHSMGCITRINTISDTIISGAFVMTSPTRGVHFFDFTTGNSDPIVSEYVIHIACTAPNFL